MNTTPMPTPEGDAPASGTAVLLPEELASELRRLAHDLANSLEVIVQTSYLLSLADLKDPALEWLHMLEGGVEKALEHNQSLRNYIREHSPR